MKKIFAAGAALLFVGVGCGTNPGLFGENAKVFPLGNSGPNLFAAYNVAGDAEGNFYVSQQYSSLLGVHTVMKYDSKWKPVYILGSQGGLGTDAASFYYPAGVAASGGKVYIADRYNHRIKVYDSATGNYLSSIGSSGSANGLFNQPIGLQIANSKIYVADSLNNRIQIFTLDGTWLESHGTAGSAVGQLSNPYDVNVDKDGNIWVADRGNLRVQKFDSTWTYALKLDSSGGANTTFNYPASVTTSGNRLYVSDLNNRRVQIFDLTGAYVATQAAVSVPQVQGQPRLISVIGGKLYVPDNSFIGRVLSYFQDGTFAEVTGAVSTKAGEFMAPTEVRVQANGDLFVGDTLKCTVQKFDSSGKLLLTLGSSCVGSVQDNAFTAVKSLDVDSEGNIYVLENYTNGSFQKFSPTGAFIWRKGGLGTTDGLTKGISLKVYNNKIYILDYGNPRISVFDTDGNFVTKFQTAAANTDGSLNNYAYGLDIVNGHVYVGELYTTCRIQKFDLTFTWEQTINTCSAVGANTSVAALRISATGDIYFADYLRSRVTILNSAGTLKGTLGTWSNQKPSGIHFYPQSIDLDTKGNAYVTFQGDAKIVKYDASGNEVDN